MDSENIRKAALVLGWSLGLFTGMAGQVQAACGINYCPIPKSQEFRQQKTLAVGLLSKYTAFDIGERSGTYSELIPRLEYLGFKSIAIGANVPLVYLREGGTSAVGLGNPLIYSEYRMAFGEQRLVFLGTQLEVPLGNHHDGLAGDHFMILPYVSATQHVGPSAYFSGTLGVSTVLGGDGSSAGTGHHAAQNAPVVNPHANQEFHYRTAIGADINSWRITPEAFVHGQYVLEDHAEQRSYVNTGGTLVFHAGKHLGLQANYEYHLTSPQRFGWRGSFGAKLGI